MSSTIKIDGGNGFKNHVKKMLAEKATLKVGFLENAYYSNGELVAAVAAQNEYGGLSKTSDEYKRRGAAKGVHVPDEINIPPRPFMQDTFDKYSGKWIKILAKTLPTTNYDIKKSFKYLGEIIQGQIQHTIANGDFVANSPMAIEIKEKDTPLRDTLQMLHSVAYEVD